MPFVFQIKDIINFLRSLPLQSTSFFLNRFFSFTDLFINPEENWPKLGYCSLKTNLLSTQESLTPEVGMFFVYILHKIICLLNYVKCEIATITNLFCSNNQLIISSFKFLINHRYLICNEWLLNCTRKKNYYAMP